MSDKRETTPPAPGGTPNGAEEKPHQVDQAAQEDAARERTENEGYD